MAKIDLKRIKAGATSQTALNQNFERITAAIENTLSRDGTAPNTLSAPLDMNSQRVINLPEPVSPNDAARLIDIQNLTGAEDDAFADQDLGNVLGEDFVTKEFTLRAEDSAALDRSIRSKLSETPSVFDFDGDSFTERLQNAIDELGAQGGGQIFIPEGTHTINAQVVVDTDNITFVGAGMTTTYLYCTYSAGPAFLLGGSSVKRNNISFVDLNFIAGVGVTIMQTRWMRTVRLSNCKGSCDRLVLHGDASLGNTKSAYIFEMYNCEFGQAGSATLHFMKSENFLGQFVAHNCFVEGASMAGVNGFHSAGNLVDLEHGLIYGGYWSRFSINWDFTGGRPAGWYWIGHFSEGALLNALRFDANNNTHTGWNNIFIIGITVDATEAAIVLRVSQTGKEGSNAHLQNVTQFGARSVGPAILVEGTAGVLHNVNISGVIANSTPTDALQDAIKIVGTSGAVITDVTVDQVRGVALGTAWRSVVRIEGTGNARVRTGSMIAGVNIGNFVDDQSAVAIRFPVLIRRGQSTLSFGSVSAASSTTQTIAVSGMQAGSARSIATINVTSGSPSAKVTFSAAVVSDNLITVTCSNTDPTNPVTVDSIVFAWKAEGY